MMIIFRKLVYIADLLGSGSRRFIVLFIRKFLLSIDGLYILLSEVNPLIFMIFYWLTCVISALIFILLPDDSFIDNSLRLEPSTAWARHMFLKSIAENAQGNYLQISYTTNNAQHLDSNVVDSIRPEVYQGHLREDNLFIVDDSNPSNIKIRAILLQEGTTPHPADITFVIDGNGLHLPSGLYCVDVRLDREGSYTASDAESVFDKMFPIQNACFGERAVLLSQSQGKNLLTYYFALAGKTRAASGYVSRMAYLSITTITTVGFGDVVPVSNKARLFVGLEPILGWLFSGLFLNAVAWRAGRRKGAQ